MAKKKPKEQRASGRGLFEMFGEQLTRTTLLQAGKDLPKGLDWLHITGPAQQAWINLARKINRGDVR